jgi:hypothetical protein
MSERHAPANGTDERSATAMKFVTVRDDGGREAEITEDEVASYRAMGFKPVDGTTSERDGAPAVAASQPSTPANGTDQRLDLLLDEIRGLRADLAAAKEPTEPQDGETVALREPGSATPAGHGAKDGQAVTPTEPVAKPADAKAADAKTPDKK